MDTAVRRLDWALLLIPLIGLVAAWPFLTQSLPSTDDGALHMLRLVEVDRCLRHGVLPLRWAPDFAQGYGYPFFNYYASLSSYIAELWHLAGLDFPQAVAAATVTALFFSGWGAYLLGRDLAGVEAGLVAATATMYVPYQFYDSAYRGNLAETWALALLPWVLWTGRRAALRRRWRAIVPCALAYAALIDTHNVYALLSSFLLGPYLILLWWSQRGVKRQTSNVKCQGTQRATRNTQHALGSALRLSAMIGLGLALSAFFWSPAFFEKGWTRFSTGLVDYRTFFLPVRELLAWPPQVDLSRLNFYPPRSLSWGMLILIALGTLFSTLKTHNAQVANRNTQHATRNTFHVSRFPAPEQAFFGAAFLLSAFMIIPPSDWVWRTVPLLRFVLIPWRYLGIASLAGSLIAGTSVACLSERATLFGSAQARKRLALGQCQSLLRARTVSPARIGTAAAIVLLVATAIPWTYAEPFPQPAAMGVPNIIRWEHSTGLIGTTAKNEYMPIWSPDLPPDLADPALLTDHDPIITRLDMASLPEGAEVLLADVRLMRADLTVQSPQAFRARYKQLYFPGWKVTIDGVTVPQIATYPYGLLGFDVPAGQHRIVVRPATTPLRLAGELTSALAALAAMAIAILDRRPSPPSPLRGDPTLGGDRQIPAPLPARRAKSVLYIAVLALIILIAKEGVIDRTENLFRAHRFARAPDGVGRVPGVQTETYVNLGNQLTLHGYDLPARPVVSGQPLRVDLYLSAGQEVDGDYMAYARLVDDERRLWSLRDNGTPEGFRPPPPTTVWPADAYGHWAYLTYSLPGTPPGTYWIEIAVFEQGTWRPLNVLDEQGQIAGQRMTIGPLQIARPRVPPDVNTLGIARPLNTAALPGRTQSFGRTQAFALKCLGSTLDVDAARPGEAIYLTLFWQAVHPLEEDVRLRLALVPEPPSSSPARAFLLADALPLGRQEHPTTAWQEGEIVRSPHLLRIPALADAGTYVVEGTPIDTRGQPIAAPIAVAELTVKSIARIMAVPAEIQHVVQASLGHPDALSPQVTLLGYDLDRERLQAGTVAITLYWRAEQEMHASFKVFAQLIGASGVVAQADAVPMSWTRPTTGWAPGEVIVDPYTLSIPADGRMQSIREESYQLIVGMYDEETLQRLSVFDASGKIVGDHLVLQDVPTEGNER